MFDYWNLFEIKRGKQLNNCFLFLLFIFSSKPASDIKSYAQIINKLLEKDKILKEITVERTTNLYLNEFFSDGKWDINAQYCGAEF